MRICSRRNGVQVSISSDSRVPVAGRPALEHVGDVDLVAYKSGVAEQLVEQLAGGAHERLALEVLVAARCLPDQHDAGVRDRPPRTRAWYASVRGRSACSHRSGHAAPRAMCSRVPARRLLQPGRDLRQRPPRRAAGRLGGVADRQDRHGRDRRLDAERVAHRALVERADPARSETSVHSRQQYALSCRSGVLDAVQELAAVAVAGGARPRDPQRPR